MPLIALGINHKSAPVDIREKMAFPPDQLADALKSLTTLPAVEEAAIISTCNRTEIYCNISGNGDHAPRQWLLEHHGLNEQETHSHLYQHAHHDSISHILRVACGLDSMVLGEPQILGQLKSAYHSADEAGSIGLHLNRLFQHAFSVAKQVRTETEIGSNPVSVAFAAARLASRIFDDLSQQTILLIGAGETIELIARHLHKQGVNNIVVANRNLEKALGIAEQFGGRAIPFAAITEQLPDSDIVISSTASTLPILGKGAVESALKQRKHKPIFMVDVAVPRDIEPEVAELDDVYLYNIDDLHDVIDENLKSRQVAAEKAETIIALKTEEFIHWQQSLDAVDAIRRFREQADATSQEILEKAQAMIRNGKNADEALNYLARTLTQKLIHTPTTRLRDAAKQGKPHSLEASELLLNLKDNQE